MMDWIPFISSYPVWARVFLLVWLLIGAGVLIFTPRTIDHPKPPSASTSPILSPPQERLLGLLAQYQRQFAADKLIIDRKGGTLHFDDNAKKGEGISLVRDLYGSEDSTNRTAFERLVESMPPDYVRLFPETRWGNPFVLSVTEAGLRYLRH
jgi:hypothetical protein